MQMNLFAIMEAIYVKQLLNPGSSGQLALMWALVYVANKCRWKEWFTVPSITLMNLTGLSRQGILKARNQLRQRGLIDYRERGTKASTYRLTVLDTMSNSVQAGLQDSVQESVQAGLQDSVQESSAYINTNTKTKTKEEEERAGAREGMTAPAPFMTPEECDAAAQQYDRVKNALVRVGIQPTLQAMDTAMGLLADYGEERLLAALRTASDHDRKGGVNWPFVRRILEDKPKPAEESKSLYEIPFIQDGEVIR